jgi:hypothetical protein
MPFFADVHPHGEMPIPMLLANVWAARTSQQVAPASVRRADYYLAADGSITCVMEAPDAAAVRQFHAALCLRCRHVRAVPAPNEPALNDGQAY